MEDSCINLTMVQTLFFVVVEEPPNPTDAAGDAMERRIQLLHHAMAD